MLLALMLGLFATTAVPGARTLDVPEPVRQPASGPAAVEPSFVRMALAIPLRPMFAELERGIPQRVGTGARFEQEREGFEVSYDARRSPFTLTARRDTVLVRTEFWYRLSAREPRKAPVSCGGDSSVDRGSFGCITRLGWGDAWHLDARSVRLPATYDRICRPKVRGVDLTELLNEKLAPRLSEPVADLVTSTLRADTRVPAAVDAAWRALAVPIDLEDELWLDLGARRLLAAPLVVSGDSLYCELAAEVVPQLLGALPGAAPPALPEPSVRLFGDSFVVPFDCELALDSLARRVQLSLAPPESPRRDVAVRVREVLVRPDGNRLLVTLVLDGALSGRVHLLGTPAYDAASGVLAASDLRWSDKTAAALRSLGRDTTRGLRGDLESLRTHARAALRLDFSRDVADVVHALGRALNRPLSRNASISGGIHERRVVGAYVSESSVGVRIAATGTARLTLR